MSEKVDTAVGTLLKITGASVAAVGVVALSAVVASGVAAGSVVAGFKAAGNTMKGILKKDGETSQKDEESQAKSGETLKKVEEICVE